MNLLVCRMHDCRVNLNTVHDHDHLPKVKVEPITLAPGQGAVGVSGGGAPTLLLLIRGMHGVTESTSLNWLFGVSCMLLMLSSCVWGSSDSISGDVIGPSV